MTLSQDQQPRRGSSAVADSNQPRSRREARDLERRQAGETGDLSGIHPSGAFDLNASGNIWDSISRRAASQLTDAASEAERRTGRRGVDQQEQSVPEPLSYVTQARPTIPTYDGPSFGRRAQQATDVEREAGFRERSFAPEASPRSSFAPATPARGLDYHTKTRAPLPTAASAPVDTPAGNPLEHTLTRRELRVMRESGVLPAFTEADLAPRSGGWGSPATPATPVGEPSVAPPVGYREPAPLTPVAGVPLGSAFTAFSDTATAPMSAIDRAELLADEPVAQHPSVVAPVEPVAHYEAVEEAPAAPIRNAPMPLFQIPTPPSITPIVVEPPAFVDGPQPITGLQGFEALIAQASAGLDAPSVPVTGPVPLPEVQQKHTFTPPAGHWSTQAEEDDSQLPFNGLLSRNVGSSSGSTNALIMSNDPQPDLMHALNSTGEILITGSLDLPRSLGSIGAPSDHYDSSEIDRLFEASQDDHQHADVAPVRAARAVSTHTSTRSVVSPRKRSGGALPMVLAITAAVMAVGVAGLLFSGYVLELF